MAIERRGLRGHTDEVSHMMKLVVRQRALSYVAHVETGGDWTRVPEIWNEGKSESEAIGRLMIQLASMKLHDIEITRV